MKNKQMVIPWRVTEYKETKKASIVSSWFIEFLDHHSYRNAIINGCVEYVYVQGNKIEIVDKIHIVHAFLEWLDKNLEACLEDDIDVDAVKESFANKVKVLIGNEMLMQMKLISPSPHFDTRDECYLYFKNAVVKVTKDSLTVLDYSELDGYVFAEQIIDRNFELPKADLSELNIPYKRFVHNIADNEDSRIEAFETVIGYMLHRFQNPAKSKAIILLDENINELDSVMGGTGKSIFVSALSYMRPYVNIDGKEFRKGNSFAFQRVSPYTSIISINDIQQNADFEMLYGKITDGFTINKKYKPEVFVPFERSPKIIITSNYYLKAPSGNSTERRRYEIELSNHYGKHLTVEDEFNHYFFYEWNQKQWDEFTLYMVNCIQKYLANGLVEADEINLNQRRLIAEVGIELMEYMDEQLLTKSKLHKKELFNDFTRGGYVPTRYLPTQKSFTVRVKKYFEYKNIAYRETPANTKAYFEVIREDSNLQPLTIADVKNEYHTVKTSSQLKKLVSKMQEHFGNSANNVLAVDLETTGLDCFSDEIVCMAICFEQGTGYNIIFPQNKLEALGFIEPIRGYLTSSEVIKVFHNAKFDLKFLANYGIELDGEIHDTIVLDHLLDPNRKTHGLKEISEIHLNYKQITFKEMTDGKAIREVPLEELTKYACEDTDLTFQLYHFINQQLNKA